MNVKLLTQSGAFDLVEVKKHLKIQIIIIIIIHSPSLPPLAPSLDDRFRSGSWVSGGVGYTTEAGKVQPSTGTIPSYFPL